MTLLKAEFVRSLAIEQGFDRIGIIRAQPSPTLDAYERWVAAEMFAGMGYMARPDRLARRRDLNIVLPGIQTMLVVAVDYRTLIPASTLNDPTRGRIAAYAWGSDYHEVIGNRLKLLAEQLAAKTGCEARWYVDTGALLERSHGQEAGLGFAGKNTMLIHPRYGSMFFLGELLLNTEVDDYDAPFPRQNMCGTCNRCLHACPTNAFPQPFVLDARLCISYWTIEHKGEITPELRDKFGNWIFGCDICNDVCPFQRFAPQTREAAFLPVNIDRAAPPLATVLALDDAAFKGLYGGSPLERTGTERLVRNACVAAGNSGNRALIPALEKLRINGSALIQPHASWALERLA